MYLKNFSAKPLDLSCFSNTRDNPGMGHCQFMRKLCKIEEIWLQIWTGPLYNLSKYAVNFVLGPQIRVHRPLYFPWWPPVFANGPLFLSILYTFYWERGHWPILMAPPITNPEYSLQYTFPLHTLARTFTSVIFPGPQLEVFIYLYLQT